MSKNPTKPRRNFLHSLLILGVTALLAFSLYNLYQRWSDYSEASSNLSVVETQKSQKEGLIGENQDRLIEADSNQAMEEYARDTLGMVQPGETIYRLPPSATVTATAPSELVPPFWQRMWSAISSFLSSIVR
jgi:cell division protein FtsB